MLQWLARFRLRYRMKPARAEVIDVTRAFARAVGHPCVNGHSFVVVSVSFAAKALPGQTEHAQSTGRCHECG